MTNRMKSLCLSAAVAGMLGGTAMTANAQPLSSGTHLTAASAFLGAAAQDQTKPPKHACKGKNACKGQGADGKNACKGQGSCRTDGKKPPKM